MRTLLEQYRKAESFSRVTIFSYQGVNSPRVWTVVGPGWPWLGVEFDSWEAALDGVCRGWYAVQHERTQLQDR